jgi:isoleucyl-tRNA synthetase
LNPLVNVILDELNVKEIEFTGDEARYIGLKGEPQFKVIGPKFGKLVQQVAEAIKGLQSNQLAELQKTDSLKIIIGDSEKTLTTEDVHIKVTSGEGYAAAADGQLKVALSLKLTETLLAEGFARELVNKIQNMRKSGGLEVTDRIKLGISLSEEAKRAIEMFGNYIQNETLAVSLDQELNRPIKQEWDINGTATVIALEKN